MLNKSRYYAENPLNRQKLDEITIHKLYEYSKTINNIKDNNEDNEYSDTHENNEDEYNEDVNEEEY